MFSPRDRDSLEDILGAARLALQYVSGKTIEDFVGDTQCQDAVIRRLEILGEAARRVSPATRASLSGLPWAAMIGMRNVMIHQYDGVDLYVVWDTVSGDLPPLVKSLERLLAD